MINLFGNDPRHKWNGDDAGNVMFLYWCYVGFVAIFILSLLVIKKYFFS